MITVTVADPAVNVGLQSSSTHVSIDSMITAIMLDDHRELTHRDAADQHPISAITDLEAELNVRPSSALTNQDIQNILNT